MTTEPTTIENEEPTTGETEIVTRPGSGIVGLAVDIEKLKAHFKQFEELKKALLNENDYYESQHGKAIGKSGWYKFGVAFNLTTIILHQEKTWLDQPKNLFLYRTKIRGIAPNGRSADDIGVCDNTSNDREGESDHVVQAMSVTRAKERVYITLIGAPEKAEGDPDEKPRQAAKSNGMKACTCFRDKMALADDEKHCKNCGGIFTEAQIRMLKKA